VGTAQPSPTQPSLTGGSGQAVAATQRSSQPSPGLSFQPPAVGAAQPSPAASLLPWVPLSPAHFVLKKYTFVLKKNTICPWVPLSPAQPSRASLGAQARPLQPPNPAQPNSAQPSPAQGYLSSLRPWEPLSPAQPPASGRGCRSAQPTLY